MQKISLTGVPETMLWPLWNRAFESARDRPLIYDPWSEELVITLDYNFRESFGRPSRVHGIRSRYGDDLLKSYLKKKHKNACVIALGEGLETQFWRLNKPDVPWYSIDLPESIDARQRLLPTAENLNYIKCSALDTDWFEAIPDNTTPFISAMGLFMYFTEGEVVSLLSSISKRFPGAELYFDAIPPHFSKKTLNGFHVTKSYVAPPMPWGISRADVRDFIKNVPNMELLSVKTYSDPYPEAIRLFHWLSKINWIVERFAPLLIHTRIK